MDGGSADYARSNYLSTAMDGRSRTSVCFATPAHSLCNGGSADYARSNSLNLGYIVDLANFSYYPGAYGNPQSERDTLITQGDARYHHGVLAGITEKNPEGF